LADLAEGGGEVAHLAGEDERRHAGEAFEGVVEGDRVGPLRLLQRGAGAPALRGPVGDGHGRFETTLSVRALPMLPKWGSAWASSAAPSTRSPSATCGVRS